VCSGLAAKPLTPHIDSNYFFLLRERKDIPSVLAFCCTAAGVRPKIEATSRVEVPFFASDPNFLSSVAVHDFPSLGGLFAMMSSSVGAETAIIPEQFAVS
jgi:hypothetical protein